MESTDYPMITSLGIAMTSRDGETGSPDSLSDLRLYAPALRFTCGSRRAPINWPASSPLESGSALHPATCRTARSFPPAYRHYK